MTKIEELMLQKKLTQIELAKLANISQSSLSSIINGKSKPKQSTKLALANALGVELAELEEANADSALDISRCPRCGSHAVLVWENIATGSCRIKCGFCEVDTKEQQSRAEAVRVLNSYHNVERRACDDVRVLSLVDLLDSSSADADDVRPVWFENRGLFITPALLLYGIDEREKEIVRVQWWSSNGNKSFELSKYGTWWRCWNKRPTEAQSEADEWLFE